ncbi:hypothetical protein GRX03_04160 [Halovenus sp. WSH3]|uniref:DUF7964 domain-containing protein n=1 Tax=Halovenus carboxidivorans TaxID=2692199 RepID=A0A6B0T7D2_9EURY|nr:hypothetical protein [Halovenus carboxidivorans]MXR50800.1 hypothetical protein [Halovenus carboxidivorans]
MALSDVLPNRPLTSSEVDELRGSDTFEQVETEESPTEGIDTIIVTTDGTDHRLHFAPQVGWHEHDH